MSTKLKLSVAQETFLVTLLSQYQDFVLECGWGDAELNLLRTIYDNGYYENWNRELLNSLYEDSKTAGIIL